MALPQAILTAQAVLAAAQKEHGNASAQTKAAAVALEAAINAYHIELHGVPLEG